MMIQNQEDFSDWLNSQLNEKIPDNIIAFNINIYESPFMIEIVGSNEFTKNDEDWVCNEDWIPTTRIKQVSEDLFDNSWQKAEENIFNLAYSYYQSERSNSIKLKKSQAFSIGFVDGNLRYVS